uniref:NADH dehydrogenase subunit 2 n=1 Tax=Thetys vagina TaxID=942565 RepID=A0AA86IRZ2_9UROC|nr:NADH dehydrogenase subunit 2 [Thetys vagina]
MNILNFLKFILIISVSLSLFAESNLNLWMVGEFSSLCSLYYLLECNKPYCRLTLLQYLFILFQFSLLILLGMITGSDLLLIVGLMGKLGVSPFHSPVLILGPTLKPLSVLFILILPKLPYLLMLNMDYLPLLFLSISLVSFMGSSFSLKESLAMSLILSSSFLMLLFSFNSSLGVVTFAATLLWGLFLGKEVNYKGEKPSLESGMLSLGMLLPIPGSYSFILKFLFANYMMVSFLETFFLVVLMSLPALFIMIFAMGNYNVMSYYSGGGWLLQKKWNFYVYLPLYTFMITAVFWL